MSGHLVPPSPIRFGRFELDLENRQLRKDGQPVRLQDQPFRTLVFLVERAGILVTRDELRAELWPEGTFVEFEHSLNTAISKVRQALSEDDSSPEYIETVPRYGYRFIGDIVKPDSLSGQDQEPALPDASRAGRDGYWRIAAAAFAFLALAAVLFRTKPPGDKTPLPSLTRLTADAGLSFEPAISRDGSLVAFASDRGSPGNLDLWVAHVSGGAPIRLTDDPAGDYEPHFCPDDRIVFRSDRAGGGVYITRAIGGTPMLLAPGGRNPQCSPDGKLVAYWVGVAEAASSIGVYIIPSGGGTATRVAADLPVARDPLWAPNGQTLLINAGEPSVPLNGDWWLISAADRRKPKPLGIRAHLGSTMQLSSPYVQPATWTPQGDVIFSAQAGQTDVASTQTSLWAIAISPDGTIPLGTPRQLTSATGIHRGASVAANGSVAFANLELNPDLWMMDLDHVNAKTFGPLRRITSDKFWESRPMIRDDSGGILFRTDRGGGWDFWQIDARTQNAKPVTISRETKVWGALTRDGKRFAYHAGANVYVVDLSTGASRPICGNCRLQVSDWLPDGSALVVNNLEKGTIDVLTIADGKTSPLIQSAGRTLMHGSISPDGQTIAFLDSVPRSGDTSLGMWGWRGEGVPSAERGQRSILDAGPQAGALGQIHTAPFRGLAKIDPASWKTITHNFVAPYTPQWSPNSDVLYFLSDADGPTCLWAARPGESANAFPVEHFHDPRFSLRGSFAVAGHRLYLGLHELTGNVWLAGSK